MHVSASQHAKAIFLPACSIFLGSVTHWKSFGSWPLPRVMRTPHVGNCLVGAGVGACTACSQLLHVAGHAWKAFREPSVLPCLQRTKEPSSAFFSRM